MAYFIVDSGSSKADWVFVNDKGEIDRFQTVGFNPSYVNLEKLTEMIKAGVEKQWAITPADKIYYYGAGCVGPERVKKMHDALSNVFVNTASVEVRHDLVAAARACLGDGQGNIAIIGTGAVMGYYDGQSVKSRVPAPGYLLDDVGSGMHMGKTLLKKYIYSELEPELQRAFAEQYKKSPEELIVDMCISPAPNRFMASFNTFLYDHREHPQAQQIIKNCLKNFFDDHICKYNNHRNVSMNFVGSIAFVYRNFIEELAKEYQVTVGKILKAPMEGLVEYHRLHPAQ